MNPRSTDVDTYPMTSYCWSATMKISIFHTTFSKSHVIVSVKMRRSNSDRSGPPGACPSVIRTTLLHALRCRHCQALQGVPQSLQRHRFFMWTILFVGRLIILFGLLGYNSFGSSQKDMRYIMTCLKIIYIEFRDEGDKINHKHIVQFILFG